MPLQNELLRNLQDFAAHTPDKVFLESRDATYTFAQFWNAACHTAATLKDKAAPGDVIGIYEPEPQYFFVYMVGTWIAGMRAMPMNTRVPDATLAACIDKAKCVLAVGSQAEKPAAVTCPWLHIEIDTTRAPVDITPIEKDAAIVMFTSGSTGIPKAIPQSFAQLIGNGRLTSEKTGLSSGDKMLLPVPPYFSSAICHFVTCVQQGAGLAVITGFGFGEQLIAAIQEYKATCFGGSPTNVRRVLGAAKMGRELDGLRFWVSSGDHLTAEEQKMFLDHFPDVRLIYIYGLSEVACRLCVNDLRENPGKLGSPGLPLPGMSVDIVSENGDEVMPPGEYGEIRVTGPLLMQGYLQADGTIDTSTVANGFRTGDMGRKDKDGFIWLVGRKDDVLKVGGEKVSVTSVENAIRKVVACKDCCVAIIEDQNLGHVLVGLVVPGAGESAGFDVTSLLQGLRRELSPNAIPAKIYQIDEVPRTGSGKVIREKARTLAYELIKK